MRGRQISFRFSALLTASGYESHSLPYLAVIGVLALIVFYGVKAMGF